MSHYTGLGWPRFVPHVPVLPEGYLACSRCGHVAPSKSFYTVTAVTCRHWESCRRRRRRAAA